MQSNHVVHRRTQAIFKSKGINYYVHFHKQAEIVYCLRETLNAKIDGKKYELHRGDVAFVFPNQHHSYFNEILQDQFGGIMIIFDPSLLEDYYAELLTMVPAESVLRKEQLPAFFHDYIETFYEECKGDVEDRKFKAYLSVLLESLLASGMELVPANAPAEADTTQMVLSYIDAHYAEQISIASVAKELGVGAHTISRIFSQKIGTSFINYVNTQRVNRAKKLLRTSEDHIKEIAAASGFQSTRSFYRVFRELTDRSPEEYRKEDREKKRRKYEQYLQG